MAIRRTPREILGQYRADGWTPKQIKNRLGISTDTQRGILNGRLTGSSWQSRLSEGNRIDRGNPPGFRREGRKGQVIPARSDRQLRPRSDSAFSEWKRHSKNYQQQRRDAEQLSRSQGKKFNQAEHDRLVRDIQRQRSSRRIDKSPDSRLADYLRQIGRKRDSQYNVGDTPTA